MTERLEENYKVPSVMMHNCNPSPWEVEARELLVPGQLGLHSKTLSQKKKSLQGENVKNNTTWRKVIQHDLSKAEISLENVHTGKTSPNLCHFLAEQRRTSQKVTKAQRRGNYILQLSRN
jgi:uncharacterized protein